MPPLKGVARGPYKKKPVEDRMWPKIKVHSLGCWEWQGAANNGYGVINVANSATPTHRVMYELEVGPIPEGLTIDHLCFNPSCCNPAHLEPVTLRENTLRQWAAGRGKGGNYTRKSHCANGHQWDEENTYVCSDGSRACRACQRNHAARYREQRRARRGD